MAQQRAASRNRLRNLTLVALGGWFLFALGASLLGVFDSEPEAPLPLGMAAVVPIFAWLVVHRTSERYRNFVASLDVTMLTLAQTWRVGGVVFLILYQEGVLPGVFAIPAGWGDIAIGVTAPIAALSWRHAGSRNAFVVWNVLGAFDLLLAVGLGVLASATPAGILAGEITTRPMGIFPLSLIPTFAVPLLFMFHLVCLDRVRHEASHSRATR